jgi:hypothetical protein
MMSQSHPVIGVLLSVVLASAAVALIGIYLGNQGYLRRAAAAVWTVLALIPLLLGVFWIVDQSTDQMTKPQSSLAALDH